MVLPPCESQSEQSIFKIVIYDKEISLKSAAIMMSIWKSYMLTAGNL